MLTLVLSTVAVASPARAQVVCPDFTLPPADSTVPVGIELPAGADEEFSVVDGQARDSGHLPGIESVFQFQLDVPLLELVESGLSSDCDPLAGAATSLQEGYAGPWPTTFVTGVRLGDAVSAEGFTEVLLLQELPGPVFGQRPEVPFAPDQTANWALGPVWSEQPTRIFHGLSVEGNGLAEYAPPVPVKIATDTDNTTVVWFTPTVGPWRVVIDGSATLDPADPSSIATVTARSTPLLAASTTILTAEEASTVFPPVVGEDTATDDPDDPEGDPAPLEPEPSTDDETVADGIPEGAVVVDVDNSTGNAEEGGGNGMVFVVLGFFFVLGTGILVVYGKWKKKAKSPIPENGGSGKPADSPGDSEGDPEVPSEPDSPLVPPGPGPQPTKCDWELHIRSGTGWKRLKKAAPGHTACCVYKVAIETTVDEFMQDAKMADEDVAGRESVPVFASQASGMTLGSSATTRSNPDPAPFEASPIRPGGWERRGEPDIAASVDRSEATKVRVDLESKCTDAASTYTGSVESSVVLGAVLECENSNPGDECAVDLAAVGSVSVSASGDLVTLAERAVGPEPDDPDDRAPLRDWDMHDHDPDRPPAAPVSTVDRDTDVIAKDGWESVFTVSAMVQARQVVPASVWDTTDEVKAHIEQTAGHALDLHGVMSKGDCAPTGCCTGNPDHICNCKPDFTLNIDGANSTINADGQTWSLTRPAGPANGATLPTDLEWTA